jgi:septal ring factor EnvC (AmiA/AmiB activator)
MLLVFGQDRANLRQRLAESEGATAKVNGELAQLRHEHSRLEAQLAAAQKEHEEGQGIVLLAFRIIVIMSAHISHLHIKLL